MHTASELVNHPAVQLSLLRLAGQLLRQGRRQGVVVGPREPLFPRSRRVVVQGPMPMQTMGAGGPGAGSFWEWWNSRWTWYDFMPRFEVPGTGGAFGVPAPTYQPVTYGGGYERGERETTTAPSSGTGTKTPGGTGGGGATFP